MYYRCVRIHCGKQIPLEVASLVIDDWVAACFSEAPIIEFESPILLAKINSPILATGTAASADSTQDSFESFVSTEASTAALVVAAAAYDVGRSCATRQCPAIQYWIACSKNMGSDPVIAFADAVFRGRR